MPDYKGGLPPPTPVGLTGRRKSFGRRLAIVAAVAISVSVSLLVLRPSGRASGAPLTPPLRPACAMSDPTVTLDDAKLIGNAQTDYNEFLGIPYAYPAYVCLSLFSTSLANS
jgi:hypothetical protein